MDIVLIAGLWLDGTVWSRVAQHIEDRGHHAVPVFLPGQGDGDSSATLEDQAAAVVAAIDASSGRPVVVGHSAASSLAWLAADQRPGAVSQVVLIGGFPTPDGEAYADFFPTQDGAMPFPGWEPFEGPDSADLDEAAREALESAAIPVPEGVSKGVVRLVDERRFETPVVLICPEFTPDQAQAWIADGDLPELARVAHLSFVDIDSGHWPMITEAEKLAGILADVAEAA